MKARRAGSDRDKDREREIGLTRHRLPTFPFLALLPLVVPVWIKGRHALALSVDRLVAPVDLLRGHRDGGAPPISFRRPSSGPREAVRTNKNSPSVK
jgi:hypothetical protein